MPDMPIPPKTRHPWDPYPHGHALYCDKRTHQELVEDNIYVVDAANAADPVQDGTFEHPCVSIGQAIELAGENTTIFVREGVYREEVVLRPRQTLTGHLHPPNSSPYGTCTMPLIAPDSVSRPHYLTDDEGEVQAYGAVVTMPENTNLLYMAIATTALDVAAVWVEPRPGCRDSFISLGGNDLYSARGNALRLHLRSDRQTGRVTLWSNSIMTTKADSDALMTTALSAVFAPAGGARPKANGGKSDEDEDDALLLLSNRLIAPNGVCLELDVQGSGNRLKAVDNILNGYQCVHLNLDAPGNRVVLIRNSVCAVGSMGSVHNFNMLAKPSPDDVLPVGAPVGVLVNDRSSAPVAEAAAVEMWDNNIIATDAFACGMRLREPAGREAHLLDFARVAAQNHIHAQGEGSRIFFGGVREAGREKVWLDEPGAGYSMKPGDHRNDESL